MGSQGACSVSRRQAGRSSRAKPREGQWVPGLAAKPPPAPKSPLSRELALQRHLVTGGEPWLEGDPGPQKKLHINHWPSITAVLFPVYS